MAIEIQHDGDTWEILGEGAVKDGKVYCHLASTTRGRQQRNGWVPLQICDWIDSQVILSHAIQQEEAKREAITAYYTDRANSGLAALAR
jgi:hypothetical protein